MDCLSCTKLLKIEGPVNPSISVILIIHFISRICLFIYLFICLLFVCLFIYLFILITMLLPMQSLCIEMYNIHP